MVERVKKKADVQDVRPKSETGAGGLDALLLEAEKGERAEQGEAVKAGEKVEKQEVDTLRADVLDTLRLIAKPAGMAAWFLTSDQFDQLWGDKVLSDMSGPIAEIMRRNGWNMKGLVSQYGPYLALGVAMGPSAMVTAKVYRQARQFQREQHKAPAAPAEKNDPA